MKCIKCGGDTYTIMTRTRVASYVQRRKECPICGARFSTYEFTDDVVQQVVALLDGKKELIRQIRRSLPSFFPANRKGE